ncbi:MAG: purine-nucleoside phosphorylase [Alphaproteobacteria bacterium]
MNEQIRAVTAAISARTQNYLPETAIILGSGLGGLADNIENPIIIPYEEIRDFPHSTVQGHAGRLVIGTLGGKEVVCLQGRVHLYEGHTPEKISLVIRVLRSLGVKNLILTNAAGSVKKDMPSGSLMVISDHINFSGFNPLIGINDDNFGPRFPDMSYAYNLEFRNAIKECGKKEDVDMFEGSYLMVAGPNFETPAEIRAFQTLGASAVGMSTVPECLVAVHCGMKVAGISVITNYGSGMVKEKQTHDETIEQADKASKKLQKILTRFIKEKI